MPYRVITQRVEINGTTREIGEVLEASAFRPLPEHIPERHYINEEPELSEIDSLLKTGHIEAV